MDTKNIENNQSEFERIMAMMRNKENKSLIMDAILKEYAKENQEHDLYYIITEYARMYAIECINKCISRVEGYRDNWV
jgi:hypothetical protein